jgi:hypothetical protein
MRVCWLGDIRIFSCWHVIVVWMLCVTAASSDLLGVVSYACHLHFCSFLFCSKILKDHDMEVYRLLFKHMGHAVSSSAYNWVRPSLWSAMFGKLQSGIVKAEP